MTTKFYNVRAHRMNISGPITFILMLAILCAFYFGAFDGVTKTAKNNMSAVSMQIQEAKDGERLNLR